MDANPHSKRPVAIGSDGKQVGPIVERTEAGFNVELGLIFKRDIYIPNQEIVREEGGRVVLLEPAAYYLEGGDMDDGHWDADRARRSRLVRQDGIGHWVNPDHEPGTGR